MKIYILYNRTRRKFKTIMRKRNGKNENIQHILYKRTCKKDKTIIGLRYYAAGGSSVINFCRKMFIISSCFSFFHWFCSSKNFIRKSCFAFKYVFFACTISNSTSTSWRFIMASSSNGLHRGSFFVVLYLGNTSTASTGNLASASTGNASCPCLVTNVVVGI